jgi:hypothetical protein
MKTKVLVWVLVIFFTAFITEVCFAEEKDYYIPKRNTELWGIWINETYGNAPAHYKWVFYNWGYGEGFTKVTDTTPAAKWTVTIIDKYTDDDGNLWYKTFNQLNYGWSGYFLYEINNDKTVLETSWNSYDFPTQNDLEAKVGLHLIYYRL